MQVPPNSTVSELEAKLLKDLPQISRLSLRPLIAVNEEYASPDLVLKNGDIVAILPPFSGGN